MAPSLGLADAAVDIVDSGKTLQKHNLQVNETLLNVSTQLIANRAVTRTHLARTDALLSTLTSVFALN